MPVIKRINVLRERLKSFEGMNDFSTEGWRRTAKDFYTDLRETWERLVEEVLLGKVVERFNSDVKTQSLKGVDITDEDYRLVFWAMKRASERSSHDMVAGKSIPVPTTADMEVDLENWRGSGPQARRKKGTPKSIGSKWCRSPHKTGTVE